MSRARLLIETPESWRKSERPNFVDYEVEAGLTITVPDLQPLPEDVWHWARAPERDLPSDGTSVKVTNRADRMTTLEWGVTVVDSEAHSATGAVVETRVHLLVPCLEYGTIISIRALNAERLAALRDSILATLDSLRPDWGKNPTASLQELLRA